MSGLGVNESEYGDTEINYFFGEEQNKLISLYNSSN